jgi:acetamidase/formamidase
VTGPFHVAGARAGDVLEVELHRVDPFPAEGVAWTGIFRGFGALQHDPYSLAEDPEPELRLVPYAHGIARFPCADGHVEVPLHPFLGTVGVAPRYEKRLSFSQAPEYLGDVDVPQITAGGTLVLPVNVEGALLGLGDAHAAQGDGEINGAALEVEAEAELTVRVAEREEAKFVELPQINNDNAIGSIAGYQGVSLADCTRAAYVDVLERLVRYYRFQKREAYELLGQVGRVQVGNMIDPFYSAMVSIDRRYLERS